MKSSLLQRLVDATPFSRMEILTLVATAPFRYKDHFIEKRNGRGKRLISQPTAELKFVQRHLVLSELSVFEISSYATAYLPRKGIRDHAARHASQHFLLKMDFKDFFPSIQPSHLARVIQGSQNYTDEELKILFNLLYRFDKNSGELRLSIGAPSSPHISNLITLPFDTEIARECDARGVTYSRYADDLAFSCNTPRVLDEIERIAEELSEKILLIKLNKDKTVNLSKKFSRVLTGLVLANDGTVSIPKPQRKILRARIHKISCGEMDSQVSELIGKLSFLHSVDPEFVSGTLKRYGFSRIEDLRQGGVVPPQNGVS